MTKWIEQGKPGARRGVRCANGARQMPRYQIPRVAHCMGGAQADRGRDGIKCLVMVTGA